MKRVWKMNAKDAAINLIKHYVLRGDSLQSLRVSHMGSHNDKYDASIAGNAWDKNDELIHKGTIDEVVVTKLYGKKCLHIYKLKDLYDEIKSGQMKLIS